MTPTEAETYIQSDEPFRTSATIMTIPVPGPTSAGTRGRGTRSTRGRGTRGGGTRGTRGGGTSKSVTLKTKQTDNKETEIILQRTYVYDKPMRLLASSLLLESCMSPYFRSLNDIIGSLNINYLVYRSFSPRTRKDVILSMKSCHETLREFLLAADKQLVYRDKKFRTSDDRYNYRSSISPSYTTLNALSNKTVLISYGT